MSDNWMPIAKMFENEYEVFLLDLRNHGRSPHSDSHTFRDLSDDIFEFLDSSSLDKVILIGHSMGGKAAMQFAFDYPERLEKLIIVDISPREYVYTDSVSASYINHYDVLRAMYRMNFKNLENRTQIDELLKNSIESSKIRAFLLKNIEKKSNSLFSWRMNVNALLRNFKNLFVEIGEGRASVETQTLFIKGGKSPYIMEEDLTVIKQKFTYSEVVTIKNAGHWIHSDTPKEFYETLIDFIKAG